MSLTKLFFLSSEIEPFSSTYSLSNFSFQFGKEIKKDKTVDIRMCQPKYGYISERKYVLREVIRLRDLQVDFQSDIRIANLKSAFIPESRVQVYFMEDESFFESSSELLYKSKNGRFFSENNLRFAFFSKTVLFALKKLFWSPEVVISNDWQTSFVPIIGKKIFQKDEFYKNIKYVHIVHSCNDYVEFNNESFESLNFVEEKFNSNNILFNAIENADLTIILNDIKNPIIKKINKSKDGKNILKNANHKIYDIDYESTKSKEQINSIINDIRTL